jgi:putative ABC transport system ATP-binding protein
MMSAAALVDIRHISKSYRRGNQIIPVLEDLSLTIAETEFLALMGPSGSGKSTLLNLIAGLDRADAGTITVGGVEISALSEVDLAAWRAAHVGFIFQFYNLIPVLTAFENVELPLVLTELSRRQRREHVRTALRLVNLEDRMDHTPRQLSGGQQQRPGQRPHPPGGRRADRRPGPGFGRGRAGPHGAAEPRAGQNRHHGDP